jgi:putative salt-induced outer membrane protein YdiY
VPWEAITAFDSDEVLHVVLPGDKVVAGKVTAREGTLEVETTAGKETAALSSISAIRNSEGQRAYERLEHPGLLSLWDGFFHIGYAQAIGNSRTTILTNALNATRLTRNDKTTLYANQIYSRATVGGQAVNTARAIRGGWGYNRNITSRVFLNTFNDYEYDRFQNLDLRFVLGGGLGYTAIKSERTQLDLLGGFAYNRESFFDLPTRNSAEAYWGDDWTYRMSSGISLRQAYRMFNNLSYGGEYRINFDLGAEISLNKWLSWQTTISDRYLSNPVIGRLKNDLLLTTGFRIRFAH